MIRKAGIPSGCLDEGSRYLDWIRRAGSVREYFSAAELILRKGILQGQP